MTIIVLNRNRFKNFFSLQKFLAKICSKMDIKTPTAPCICCYIETVMSAQQKAINDKLQDSLATYLRCDGVVNNQIKKGLLLSLSVKTKFKNR